MQQQIQGVEIFHTDFGSIPTTKKGDKAAQSKSGAREKGSQGPWQGRNSPLLGHCEGQRAQQFPVALGPGLGKDT